MPTPSATATSPAWRQALAQAVRDPRELLALLELPDHLAAAGANDQFALRVPRSYVARMRPGDPQDPLLAQVLPTAAELLEPPTFTTDPVGDLASMARPGVLHKYQGRVLLVTTGACAIHCRYCFRRHFPYANANPAAGAWDQALDYIAQDPSIREVILSGGDPLAMADNRLAALAERLAAIPHLRRLRLHTRLPIVLPERVDSELTGWLGGSRLQTVVVVHANHRNELDTLVADSLARLRQTGATLLNQAVLLRGVNDSVSALAELSEGLFAAGVLPYYLHQLDRVQGAAHFEVSDQQALSLLDALRAELPGYLVPALIQEVAGAPAKQPLSSASGKP